MQKGRLVCLVAAALLCCALPGCAGSEDVGQPAVPEVGGQPDGAEITDRAPFTVVGEADGVLFLTGDGCCCTLGIEEAEQLLGEGAPLPAASDVVLSDSRPACTADNHCGGAETASLAVVGHEPSVAAMYSQLLRDLVEADTGVGEEIRYLAFDLSGAKNVSDCEKAALCSMISRAYGLECLVGDFDELCARGYIDGDALFFPDGILLSIEAGEGTGDGFEFEGMRWRGGLGAVFLDCRAELEDDEWRYEVQSAAIS